MKLSSLNMYNEDLSWIYFAKINSTSSSFRLNGKEYTANEDKVIKILIAIFFMS